MLKRIEMETLMMIIQRWEERLGMRRKNKAMESLKKHWLSRYIVMPRMLSCDDDRD